MSYPVPAVPLPGVLPAIQVLSTGSSLSGINSVESLQYIRLEMT
jgi:hypothetical protein